MTNEEIKKALEFCAKDDYYFCGGCSYDDVRNCNDKLKTDARELIIEQENEIAQLKAENIRLTTKLGQVLLSIDTVKEMNTMCNIEEQVKQAKIDVLNELEEHIQNAIDAYWDSDGSSGYCHADNVIDYIDEMIEELKK